MTQSSETTIDARPPGVPHLARRVTLAQLRDDVAQEGGSLRLGPRGSYLRFEMRIPHLLFGLRGTARAVLGGGTGEHGGRVFALEYAHGTRRPSGWRIMAFTSHPTIDWAGVPVWIWTLADHTAWMQAGRP